MDKKNKKLTIPPIFSKLGVFYILAFTVVCYVILVCFYENYLAKIEGLSFFAFTPEYFDECRRTPGWLVVWLSTLATTTFHIPALGAGVFALLMFVLSWLTAKGTHMPKFCWTMAVLPSAMAMLSLVNLGYIIFSLKSPGYAFTPLIGTILAMLLYWGYRGTYWQKICYVLIFLLWGYPRIGFYALLFAALAVAGDLSDMIGKKEKRSLLNFVPVLIAVTLAVVWPKILFEHMACDLTEGEAYMAPLPRFYEGEEDMWLTYYVMFGSLVVFAFMRALWSGEKWQIIKLALSVMVYVASLAAVIFGRYSDSNFDLSLTLDRALWDCDWQKAQTAYNEYDGEPTRLNVVLSDVAILRAGEAPEKIFSKRMGSADYTTARALRVMHEAGAPIVCYNLGLNRMAYRMAMENRVEYGMSTDMLKLLIKTSLLNKDYKLAEKYLDIMARVPFQGDWTEKYRDYPANPQKIVSDREMAGLIPLLIEENSFLGDSGKFERYIWPYLSERPTNNPQQLDQAMIASLMSQDLDRFKALCDKYLETHTSLPLHYQEGILAWSLLHSNNEYKNYPINGQVLDRFNGFVQLMDRTEPMGREHMLNALYQEYGDNYLFYFMYKNHLAII